MWTGTTTFLSAVWAIVRLWHVRQFRKFAYTLVWVGVSALIVLLPALALTKLNPPLQYWWLTLGMTGLSLFWLYLAIMRAAMAIEIATAIEIAFSPHEIESIFKTAMMGAGSYLRIVMAMITTEIGIGAWILFLLPADYDVATVFLLIPFTIGLVSYTIWIGGEVWWKWIMGLTVGLGFTGVVFALLFPKTTKWFRAAGSGYEDPIISALEGTGSLESDIWLFVLAVLFVIVAVRVVNEIKGRTTTPSR